MKKIVSLNKIRNARIKIILTRGENGFDFLTCKKPTLLIEARKILPESGEIYTKGVKAVIYKFSRIFPQSKTLSLIHLILANRYKGFKKAYEAILIDEKNFVREGAETNIFIVKNGLVITPKNKILQGTARKFILKMMKDLKMKFIVKDFKVGLLKSADEIFITNRIEEIVPVIKLDDKIIGTGHVGVLTKNIMKNFDLYVQKTLGK